MKKLSCISGVINSEKYSAPISKLLRNLEKRHPDKKLRLLFHCSWSEPNGWPLNQIREQNGLKQEDILTTYYCKKCSDWTVKPFTGEDTGCNSCKSPNSMITAGIGSSIDEVDLNKIYNISDGSASIFTSGAFELTNAESMLAGVPLACPNYVCGEDFIESGLVYEIKGNYAFEHQTGFKKFNPDIGSVCDFFEYIYNLPEKKKKEIVENGRKWAIDNFDAQNVVKKYEEFLDKCEVIDWEPFLAQKKEIKNIHAQVEDKENDDDFVVECYSKILNMSPGPEDEGRKHWNNFLKQPRDKNQLKNEMVIAMRNAGHAHNQKVNPTTIESLLDKSDKSRVLLTLKESYGDNFILTSLLPEIQIKYPESTIYIATDPKYWEIYDCCPVRVKLIPWSQEMENEMSMTGFGTHKGHFNYFHNIGLTTQRSLSYLSSIY